MQTKYQTKGEAVWSTYIDRGKRKSQEYSREDEKREEGGTYREIGVGGWWMIEQQRERIEGRLCCFNDIYGTDFSLHGKKPEVERKTRKKLSCKFYFLLLPPKQM